MADAYKTIAKGALVILLGTIISKIFTYLYRILLARGLGPEVYGIFSICFAVVSILAALAMFGTPSALERYIPLFKKDKSKIRGLVLFVFKYTVVFGIVLAVLLILFSDKISIFLGNSAINSVMIVFALSIPVLAALQIFSSITKAFKNVVYYTLTNNIIYPLFNLLFAFILISLGYGLTSIAWAFLTANTIAVLFLMFVLKNKLYVTKEKAKTFTMRREIFFYSFPLLFASLFFFIISWTDTVMLAYFLPETIVGLYNVAIPTAQLMYTVPIFILPLFLPIISGLFSKNNTEEISKLFKTVTYWIMALNLPLLLLLILFAEPILKLLFGTVYMSAAVPMMILSIGFFVYTLFLPAVRILELFKRTKFIFIITSVGAGINIVLNLLLIPKYGMLGAAVASAIALITISISAIIKIKMITGITPFSINFLKATLAVLFILLPCYYLYKLIFMPDLINMVLFGLAFSAVYFVVMYKFVFTGIDKELVHSLLTKFRIVKRKI